MPCRPLLGPVLRTNYAELTKLQEMVDSDHQRKEEEMVDIKKKKCYFLLYFNIFNEIIDHNLHIQ